MTREAALAILREHAAELHAEGVQSLSLFGSTARGESTAQDVDVAVRLRPQFSEGGIDYFWRRDQLRLKLEAWLGSRVDIVEEPARKASLQNSIARDRVLAF
jgi:uncharacterized protein